MKLGDDGGAGSRDRGEAGGGGGKIPRCRPGVLHVPLYFNSTYIIPQLATGQTKT